MRQWIASKNVHMVQVDDGIEKRIAWQGWEICKNWKTKDMVDGYNQLLY